MGPTNVPNVIRMIVHDSRCSGGMEFQLEFQLHVSHAALRPVSSRCMDMCRWCSGWQRDCEGVRRKAPLASRCRCSRTNSHREGMQYHAPA